MENQNSVAYVGIIGSVVEIPGADNIELVLVNGWQAITKKGEYKVDDLVVVATTDAVIPKELSDKLGVTNYLRKGQRVRTVKLRGFYSECLLIPNKYIPGFGDVYYLGMDLMEKMGIADAMKSEVPKTFAEKQNVYSDLLAQVASEMRNNPADLNNFRSAQ